MTTKKSKQLAALISILFIFVTFASLFYIVKEENHKCTGENCPICASVHQAEQTLKNLSTGTIVAFRTIFVLIAVVSLFSAYCWILLTVSLVSQKVRMND